MTCHFPAGAALSALLRATALLSPSLGFAQAAPTANQPQTSTPVIPAQATPDKGVLERPGMDDKNKASNKTMAALRAFFDARLAGLRAGLELTPEQAPLWTPVEAAIRDLAKAHAAAHRDTGDDEPTDALGQLKRMSERLIRGGQTMKALADATAPLLATLTDDQKDRLPKLLNGIQPKKILEKAFNLPLDRDAANADEQGGYRNHRDRDDAYEDRGPSRGYGRRDNEDRDDDYKRDFDYREYNSPSRGRQGRHGNHDRGEDRDAGTYRNGRGEHDDVDRDRHGSGDFDHSQDDNDRRT
jgi:hypothetical protein